MHEDETRDDEWANQIARGTFRWTVITAVLFIGFVFVFILFR
ncbi:MAG: hypothetical protein ABIS67_01285 [Candidatus Eisenbacteria bacterium]